MSGLDDGLPPRGPEPGPEVGPRGDLRRRSARGGATVLGAQAVKLVLGVASTAVLARLLAPDDFGVFFMVTALTEFVSSFRDFGFPMATVHRERVDRPLLTALFWLNARFATIVLVGMVAMGPVVAAFFGEPVLVGLTAALAVAQWVDGLTVLQLGLLRRELRFGALAAVDLTSVVVGVLAGVAAALAGGGPWALAAQLGTIHLAHAAGLWWACPWRPGRPAEGRAVERASLADVRRFGRETSHARVVAHVGRNLDRVLVGHVLGAGALGLYQQAYRWAVLPVQQVHAPLLPVVVSTLSRLRDDTDRYRATFRVALRAMLVVTLPALALGFVEAEAVVLVLLGDQWLGAVAPLRTLLAGAVGFGVLQVLKWVNYSEGETRRQLTLALATAPVTVLGVAVGVAFGTTGVALGWTLAVLATAAPSVAYCLRRSRLVAGDLWCTAARPAVAAVVAAAAVAATWQVVPAPDAPLARLAVAGALFAAVDLAVLAATAAGRRDLGELVDAARAAAGGRLSPAPGPARPPAGASVDPPVRWRPARPAPRRPAAARPAGPST